MYHGYALSRSRFYRSRSSKSESWDEQFRQASTLVVETFRKKKDPDWDSMAQLVLASKPPRAKDLPAQMDYCKRRGGGVTQKYILDALDYIQMKGSGNIFTVLFLVTWRRHGAHRQQRGLHQLENSFLRRLPAPVERRAHAILAGRPQRSTESGCAGVPLLRSLC